MICKKCEAHKLNILDAMTDKELIQEIYRLERLLDDEDFCRSLFEDDYIEILQLMKEVCVKRMAISNGVEIYGEDLMVGRFSLVPKP